MNNPAPAATALERALARFAELLGLFAASLFVVVMVVVGYEVTARYVFAAPTIWAHEVSVLLAASAFIIGGPFVHARREHIVISVFYDRFPARVKRWLDPWNAALASVFLSAMAYAAWVFAWESIQLFEKTGTALDWPIPMLLKTALASAASLMALQSLAQLLSHLLGRRGETGPSHEH